MASSTGMELAQGIREGIEDLKRACTGVDEDTASRAPQGRWSPKEILSHLWGPEGTGLLPTLKAFLDQDTPTIDVEPENPYFSENRRRMTLAQLLDGVGREYERMALFAEGLTGDQLDRKAIIPMLQGTSFGEISTLESWVGLMGGAKESHLAFHIGHLREILRDLGVPGK